MSLLTEGADPNHPLYWSPEWRESESFPPLHTACDKGYLEIVKELVSRGADTSRGDGRYGRTPLHCACVSGHTEVVMYLCEEGGCSSGE